jgi:hypothetical protein
MKLDHIVIGTRDLNEGTRYLESCLRCTLAPGGQHIGFGTHNRLLNLGDGAYLELIALDPDQVDNPSMPIKHKAPFGLGEAQTQAKISKDPQLLAWVVSTDHLLQHKSLFEHIGQPTTMRRGEMQWTITHRGDGQAVGSGLPTLIDWGDLSGSALHPSKRLPPSSVSLVHFESNLDPNHLEVFTSLFEQDQRLRLGSVELADQLHARLKIGEGEYFEF